jgi:hypothetical protein
MRVRDLIDEEGMFRKRRRSRPNPRMIFDFVHRMTEGPGDPIKILIVASMLRDEAPWIYELALEAYRAVRSGRREEGRAAVHRFIEAVELMQRGPLPEIFGVDPAIFKIVRSEFLGIFDYSKLEPESQNAAEAVSQKRSLSEEKEAV